MPTTRIRPTAAAMNEPMSDSHYLPADPRNLLQADPSRRIPVKLKSAGLTLAGHLYRPSGAPSRTRTPGIVFVLLPEYAQEIYAAAIGPKELIWIETHNHIELYDQDPYVSEAAGVVLGWLGRYLVP